MAFFALETAIAVYFSLWLLPYVELVHIFSPKYSAWNYPAGFACGVTVLLIVLKSIEKVLRDKFYKIESTMSFEDLPVLNLILSLFSGALTGYMIGSAVLMLMALAPATKEFIPEYNPEIVKIAETTAMDMSHTIEVFSGENKKLDELRHDFLTGLFFSKRAAAKSDSRKTVKSILERIEEEHKVEIMSGFSLDEMFLVLFAEVSSIHLYFSKTGNMITRITEVVLKHFSHILELLRNGKPVPENYPQMVIEKTLSPEVEEQESSFAEIVYKPYHVMHKDRKIQNASRHPVLKKKLDIIYLQHRRIIRQQLSHEDLMTTEIRII